MLDLVSAHENIRAGRQGLERTAAAVEETTQSYAMGTASKTALYEAQRAANDAAASLFQTMGAYTKLVNRLNDLSGGWLAKEYDWFAEPFGVLYETAIRQAQEEAEAEKQQSADPAPSESQDAPQDPAPTPSANESAAPEAGDEEQAVG